MKRNLSRRSLLAGAGCALAGTAAGQLLAVAQAQEAAQSRQGSTGAGICLTMVFENAARAKFDSSKYVKRHLPLLREVYGDTVERIELRTAAGSVMGVPSAVLATTTMWINDVPAFSQNLAANAEKINKDLDAVAKGNRLVQPDRIALEVGDARGEVPVNSHVFSMFYPSRAPVMGRGFGPGRGPGGGGPQAGGGAPRAGGAPAAGAASAGAEPAAPSLDAGYFTDVYLPKLYSLYGSNAIRRMEATLGMDQGGQKAAHLAAYHLLIRDRDAYDQRQASVFGEMQKDAGNFTTIFPLLADMRVTAIA